MLRNQRQEKISDCFIYIGNMYTVCTFREVAAILNSSFCFTVFHVIHVCFPYLIEVAFFLKSAFLYQNMFRMSLLHLFSHFCVELKFTIPGFYTEQTMLFDFVLHEGRTL